MGKNAKNEDGNPSQVVLKVFKKPPLGAALNFRRKSAGGLDLFFFFDTIFSDGKIETKKENI